MIAVLELAHVELARGCALFFTVRNAVDGESAGAADAFSTITLEGDGFLALSDELLVDDVEHFEKGCVLADANGIRLESTGHAVPILAPDLEREIEVFRHRLDSPHLYER